MVVLFSTHKILIHKLICLKHYIKNLLFATATLISFTSFAADLGKHGALFEIEEPDMLMAIEHKLSELSSSGELERFNRQIRGTMIKDATNPIGIPGITKATVNSTRKFDPTVTLDDDIIVDQKVLYPKGTRINPLNYTNFQKLIFIDGTDEAQAAFARDVVGQDSMATIILVNGKPGLHEIAGKEYFYYFDQAGIYSTRFNIKSVPSFVYQYGNEQVLTIDEIQLQRDKSSQPLWLTSRLSRRE